MSGKLPSPEDEERRAAEHNKRVIADLKEILAAEEAERAAAFSEKARAEVLRQGRECKDMAKVAELALQEVLVEAEATGWTVEEKKYLLRKLLQEGKLPRIIITAEYRGSCYDIAIIDPEQLDKIDFILPAPDDKYSKVIVKIVGSQEGENDNPPLLIVRIPHCTANEVYGTGPYDNASGQRVDVLGLAKAHKMISDAFSEYK